MKELKPWAQVPFDLLRHAEGHLKAASDFDKRIAFINYDNAIEVAISAYLNAESKKLGYTSKEVEEKSSTFSKMLDFFEQYIRNNDQEPKITKDEIEWYHYHRNDFYHEVPGGPAVRY